MQPFLNIRVVWVCQALVIYNLLILLNGKKQESNPFRPGCLAGVNWISLTSSKRAALKTKNSGKALRQFGFLNVPRR